MLKTRLQLPGADPGLMQCILIAQCSFNVFIVLVILPVHVVFGVHVIFAIIVDLAHAIYSISRSFASCPHCLGRDGSEGILCRPCSKAGERIHDRFCIFLQSSYFSGQKESDVRTCLDFL